jgi:hypothetical protein
MSVLDMHGRPLPQRPMTIIDAMGDARVFASQLKTGPNWTAWKAFLAALFGLALTVEQQAIFKQCTGRQAPRPDGYAEAWLCCGRRALKSFTLALIACFLACFRDWRPHLGPGELGTVMIIAADRRQARVIMRYVVGLLHGVPMLRQLIESETQESVTLKNRIIIEVHTASFRSTRGYSLIAALLDEVAYWPAEDSAEPDHEIIAALRPAMSTVPGSVLLCASSPYARKGAMWDAHHRHYGKDSEVFVQAPSRYMNPSVPEAEVARALEEDSARANADYNAVFRSDRESIITREAVLACTEIGVLERPPFARGYVAFVDPSGGSSDSFTLAIAHREGDKGVLDAIREFVPPFSPDAVCAEIAALCKSYSVAKVVGDNYAKEWPRERFRVHGLSYEASAKVKTVLYTEFLAILNSRRVELLDHPRLLSQLVSLERHTGPSGRDQITHPPNGHDDIANAVAGAVVLVAGQLTGGQRLARYLESLPAAAPAAARPAVVWNWGQLPPASASLYAADPMYRRLMGEF